jgi:hypothetical protein
MSAHKKKSIQISNAAFLMVDIQIWIDFFLCADMTRKTDF